jgi:hypothetical protein
MNKEILTSILGAAELCLGNFKRVVGKEHTRGFCLCIIDPEGDKSQRLIGNMSGSDSEHFSKSALRKALQLQDRPEHFSGGQSHDPEALLYLGAVRTEDGYIIAVAGLTEEWDEMSSSFIAYVSPAVVFGKQSWNRVQMVTSNPHMISLPTSR